MATVHCHCVTSLCALLLLVTSQASATAGGSAAGGPPILELTDDNFETTVTVNKHLLVVFYAPWCRHCQQLEPELALVANTVSTTDVQLARVDGTVQVLLLDKFQVSGFPTILLFSGRVSSPIEFAGERSASQIISWVRRHTEPRVRYAGDVTAIELLRHMERVLVLGLFRAGETGVLHLETFSHIANSSHFESVLFLTSTNEAVFEHYSISTDSTIVIFRQLLDGAVVKSAGDLNWNSIDDVEKFISLNLLPPVIEFCREISRLIASSHVTDHLLLFASSADAAYQQSVDMFQQAALTFHSQVLFILFDISNDDSRHILESLDHIPDSALPAAVSQPIIYYVQSARSNYNKFLFDLHNYDVISTDTIRQFVNDVHLGNVKVHVRSETLPTDVTNHDGLQPVKILTANNFATVLLRPNQHVLVQFYAPWCKHCQRLAPVWAQLASIYAHSDDVTIAQIDITANDVSDVVAIQAFPTIKLFIKDSLQVIDFAKERTLHELMMFVESVRLLPHTESNAAAAAAAAADTHVFTKNIEHRYSRLTEL